MPAKDPEHRRATVRAWYQRTKHRRSEADRARAKARRDNARVEVARWYVELKAQLVCSCGESHPACIQFHHPTRATKEASVANALRRRWSRARILAEIAKCEVLCANCHAKRHASQP